jgi:hypothetical protein
MKKILFWLGVILLLGPLPLQAANFIDYTLTSDRETVPCVRDLPEPRDIFDAQEHEEFYVLVVLDEVEIGDTVQFEWLFEGDLYRVSDPYVFEEPYRPRICVGEGLEITGTEVENMTGEWSVRISVEGVYLLNYRFYLEGLIPATTSTTTTQSNSPCAMALLYGDYSDETTLLRFVRDSILSKTPEGREVINLYYQWSPIIVQTMTAEENFKKELKDIIDDLLPLLDGTVD